jgi:hypothetical protein
MKLRTPKNKGLMEWLKKLMGGGKLGMFMVEKDRLFFNSTPK